MSDAWSSMLYQLCPTYDDLKFSMEKGPTIKPILEKKSNRWILTFQEKWYHDSGGSYTTGHVSVLDNIVEWSEKELINWKDTRRIAWNMWQFKYKRDAEKFIVFYNLKWAQ